MSILWLIVQYLQCGCVVSVSQTRLNCGGNLEEFKVKPQNIIALANISEVCYLHFVLKQSKKSSLFEHLTIWYNSHKGASCTIIRCVWWLKGKITEYVFVWIYKYKLISESALSQIRRFGVDSPVTAESSGARWIWSPHRPQRQWNQAWNLLKFHQQK